MAMACAAQANVINMVFNSPNGAGGSHDVIMDSTPFDGANAPTEFTGFKWNEFGSVPTTWTIGLQDTDDVATGMTVTFGGSGNQWSITSLPFTEAGALSSYSYATTSMTIAGGTGLYDIYILTQDNTPAASSFSIGADTQTTDASNPASYTEGANYVKFSSVDVSGGVTVDINQGPINGFQMVAVPEPATLGLIAAFGGGLVFIRRYFNI